MGLFASRKGRLIVPVWPSLTFAGTLAIDYFCPRVPSEVFLSNQLDAKQMTRGCENLLEASDISLWPEQPVKTFENRGIHQRDKGQRD